MSRRWLVVAALVLVLWWLWVTHQVVVREAEEQARAMGR